MKDDQREDPTVTIGSYVVNVIGWDLTEIRDMYLMNVP